MKERIINVFHRKRIVNILLVSLVLIIALYAIVLSPMELVETLLWTRLKRGNNVLGVVFFVFMNLYGGYILSRGEKGVVNKFFAFGAGMCVAHFFHHLCDISTIPTLWYIRRKFWVSGYMTSITMLQLVGGEAVVVYAYRDKLNLENILYFMSFIAVWVGITLLFHGVITLKHLKGVAALNYYLYVYIPCWIIRCVVFSMVFKKEEVA